MSPIRAADPFEQDSNVLDLAHANPPSAANEAIVLVLSPHQWNFDMEVTVEVWSAQPTPDPDAWEQVSFEPLTVDGADTMLLGSPTCQDISLPVPAGTYALEISGRGFANYGVPFNDELPDGSGAEHAEPKDVWRLRLWESSNLETEQTTRRLWQMPGYGTPWDPANVE